MGTPDEFPDVGSPVFCGLCGSLQLLDVGDDGAPELRRARPLERERLLRRHDVRTVRDAYQLDQIEARLPRASEKAMVKDVGGGVEKVRSGETVRFEFKGPDA